jgi:hypothetical protein
MTKKGLCYLGLSLCLFGCSNPKELGTSFNLPDQKPGQLVAFDQKLAAAVDEESTEEAVSFFLDKVMTNLTPNPATKAGTTLQSNQRQELIANVTHSEMRQRGIPSSSGSQIQSDTAPITCATLAKVLSESYTANGDQRRISEVQVQQTQQAIRMNIPHLATSDSPDMSTLEASVIAYYMLTGDTGESTEAVMQLAASENDLVTFISKIQGR